MNDAVFFAGFAFLLVHEMDAVRHHEWRMLPGFSRIKEEAAAYWWFTIAHVPLYAVLLWAIVNSDGGGPNRTAVLWLNVFFVVHAILHLALYNHSQNRFRSPWSYVLIVGAGLCGAAGLLLRL